MFYWLHWTFGESGAEKERKGVKEKASSKLERILEITFQTNTVIVLEDAVQMVIDLYNITLPTYGWTVNTVMKLKQHHLDFHLNCGKPYNNSKTSLYSPTVNYCNLWNPAGSRAKTPFRLSTLLTVRLVNYIALVSEPWWSLFCFSAPLASWESCAGFLIKNNNN